ncbi:MAG: hypothetical protein AMXMBFR64_60060 [Myxococcales bacterium]
MRDRPLDILGGREDAAPGFGPEVRALLRSQCTEDGPLRGLGTSVRHRARHRDRFRPPRVHGRWELP